MADFFLAGNGEPCPVCDGTGRVPIDATEIIKRMSAAGKEPDTPDAIFRKLTALLDEVKDRLTGSDWVTIEDAAAAAGTTRSTINRRIAAGQLITNGMTGRARRVLMKEGGAGL